MRKTQYLQQLGHSWYLRVKVPTALQGRVGSTHIRRALGTRDLDEAVRRKWAALAQVRAYLDQLRSAASQPQTSLPATFAISCTQSTENPGLQSIANLGQPPKPVHGLDSLAERWIEGAGTTKTVRYQRRQAYGELRKFLGKDCTPDSISGPLAAEYVDARLLKSNDSPGTRRRKLSALGAFWEWMSSRGFSTKGSNPWRGIKVPATNGNRTSAKKRPYTMPELLRLFSGTPTYPCLREVMALALFTGARIDEICSLRCSDVRWEDGAAFIRIAKSKTRAGERTLAVCHPIPVAVLHSRSRRIATGDANGQLFHELKGGGYDLKLSWHVGQAFRYHRNKQGLDGETDFHSLRRTFITQAENLSIDQVHIARYVGHSLPTLAFMVYSGGSTDQTQRATASKIYYPSEVESAVRAFLSDCVEATEFLAGIGALATRKVALESEAGAARSSHTSEILHVRD